MVGRRLIQRAAALGDDPESYRELQTAVQQMQGKQPLLQALQEFIEADSWNKSHDYLQRHPELLSDEADDLLARLAQNAQQTGDENGHHLLTEHLTLLRHCRKIGITAAFAAKLNVPPEVLIARQQQGNLEIPPQFQQHIQHAIRAIQRYQVTGQRILLEQAVTAWEQILSDADFPHAAEQLQLAVMNEASGAFLRRYRAQGQLADLNRALQLWQEAVQRTPSNSPNRPSRLNNLGLGLSDRYTRTGQLADLEAAIAAWQDAVQHTPPDSSDRAMILNNLGNGFRTRYARSGQLADLEAAITTFQDAVQSIPPDSPDQAMYLTSLGAGLSDRYTRTGQLADLEAAITAYQKAVQRISPGSPDRAMILNNLGAGLRTRYARSGQLADLEAAITALQDAVQYTPPDASDRAALLNNLGTGLLDRHARSGQLADLEAAITAYQEAVQRTPPDGSNRAVRLNNLGNGLREHYVHTDQLADLEAAITAYQEAVQRTLPDAPNHAMYLNNLGNGLRDRYVHTGKLADLEAAITAYQEAVQRISPGSPDRAGYLNNLGNGLSARYTRTGELTDLEVASAAYREACQKGLLLQRAEALNTARNWGKWALTRHNWTEAEEAYQYGLDALEQLYRAQLLQQSRQSWQRAARSLVVTAAYAQARTGQVAQAVLTLEQGRTRQLNDRLARDQARLEDLAQQQPRMVDQYRQLTVQLRQLETVERQQTAERTETPDWTQHRQQLQAVTTQLDALIKQIRRVPGYESFLSPVSWDTLLATLQPDMPLLYLLTTEVGSLALLVQAAPDKQDTVAPIWLDNFTRDDLDALLIKRANGSVVGGYLPGQLGQRRWLRAALREGLPRLGANMLAPIAEHLQQQAVKKLVLIPTGRLNLLPLHAAPYTIDGRTEIFGDAFCITYAPSAQSVAHSRQRVAHQPTTPPTLISVGDPQPVTANPLVFARHEASQIMQHFPERGALFLTTDATLTAVKLRLAWANYIHLSCHGLFESENPLQSGLFFSHDQRLTLADLLDETNLTAARLAVLSACQTAINDFNDLPDEVIGLPAGFLQAGVPGVIGTLWPVNDHSTALLMVRFYHYHMEEGLPPAAALQKAQHWLRNATRREIGDYYRSFIRMSAEEAGNRHWEIRKEGKPDDRPYEHPYYWAAFAFYGA